MRAVVQRVLESEVRVDGAVKGRIGQGLLVLLGVGHGDGPADADYLADKIVHLRIFEDDRGKMNRSLLEVDGSVLAVSQFTLLGDCRKGRRPSFVRAAAPETAEKLIDYTVEKMRALGAAVETGVFGAMMRVSLINDGPVTLMLDSPH